jgi:hypothetical protein
LLSIAPFAEAKKVFFCTAQKTVPQTVRTGLKNGGLPVHPAGPVYYDEPARFKDEKAAFLEYSAAMMHMTPQI